MMKLIKLMMLRWRRWHVTAKEFCTLVKWSWRWTMSHVGISARTPFVTSRIHHHHAIIHVRSRPFGHMGWPWWTDIIHHGWEVIVSLRPIHHHFVAASVGLVETRTRITTHSTFRTKWTPIIGLTSLSFFAIQLTSIHVI